MARRAAVLVVEEARDGSCSHGGRTHAVEEARARKVSRVRMWTFAVRCGGVQPSWQGVF
jgi:hypothetical protein